MLWVRRFVIFLAIVQASFWVFDGLYALIRGDYLPMLQGPWIAILESSGIAPRSSLTKVFLVGYGLAWIAATRPFAVGRPWGRAALMAAAIGSLWHLGPGTPVTVAQIAMLILLPSRVRLQPA